MIFAYTNREWIKMRHCLSIAYMSLLLVSVVSSCLLFLIVASEATKPQSDESRGFKSADIGINENVRQLPKDAASVAESPPERVAAGDPPPSDTTVPLGSEDDTQSTGKPIRVSEKSVSSVKSDSSHVGKNKNSGKVPKVVVENINGQSVQASEHRLKPQQTEPTDADRDEVQPIAEASASATTAPDTADADKDVAEETLPDIPVNPAVITLGEKTPEIVLDDDGTLDSSTNNTEHRDNDLFTAMHFAQDGAIVTPEPKTVKKEIVIPPEVAPEEPPPKIDDSGGRASSRHQDASNNIQDVKDSSIPAVHDSSLVLDIPVSPSEEVGSATSATPEVNLTVEENPMPVFSEWAQKQMEEAEKKLEKEVVNSSSNKKNTVSGSKQQPMKLRTKNYASPDCGAKIIASNSDAQNTGALLTATKDEYMLSPCTNRIWFVVELCEAIQAEKVELANFELFSSSPKNFSVAVSNRFPTREWSNVGRFVAQDQRNIQSFSLHPHLFGKFVRVDIHSHYNSEHFCPISLFRVYGTSEFEAFETENRLAVDDMDDFDEEDAVDVGGTHSNKNENNLFKSASDAVLSIVKKAAEVLVKTNSNKTEAEVALNGTISKLRLNRQCSTLRHVFSCDKCRGTFVNRTNYLLSCRYNELTKLLNIEVLRAHLLTSQICAKRFNLDTLGYDSLTCTNHSSPFLDEHNSFILNAFPLEYLAALCHILVTDLNHKRHSRYGSTGPGSDSAMNLTIDQKPGSGQFVNIETTDRHTKPIGKGKVAKLPTKESASETVVVVPSKKQDLTKAREEDHPSSMESGTKTDVEENSNVNDAERSTSSTGGGSVPTSKQDVIEPVTIEEARPTVVPDVNIFNLVDDTPEPEDGSITGTEVESPTSEKTSKEDSNQELSKEKSEEFTKPQDMSGTLGSVDIEPTAWDNIDHMLNEQAGHENVGNSDGGSFSQQMPQRVHSESVFLRLSNRVKSLERNMSLSGQYLEELSRRYKKQVEELQHSFAKTLASIDEQNRRAWEKEQILITQNLNLKKHLDEISSRLNNWIIFGICFFIFLMLQSVVLWWRGHRENRRILKHFEECSLLQRRHSTPKRRRLLRQKSVEGVSGHPTPTHKVRRPSAEADRITGSYKNLLIGDDEIQNIDGNDETKDTFNDVPTKSTKQRNRRSGVASLRRNGSLEPRALVLDLSESASGDFVRPNVAPTVESQEDDKVILEDDYESYVPGTDLAYNEFMPEGPSGNQINGKVQNGTKNATKKSSKVRRLSSPSFLKSTFSRSGSTKKSPHSPTGWEWYRLRKSETKPHSRSIDAASDITTSPSSQQSTITGKQKKKAKSESPELSIKLNGFGNGSSTPNSSISAANYNYNGSDESIRTSDTSLTNTTTGSMLSNGNRRNSSTKKHGSFKRMLKKVF